MSASESSMPGGQPSITQPIAGPWDSPKVVTVKRVPRDEPDISQLSQEIQSRYDPSRPCPLVTPPWLADCPAHMSASPSRLQS